MFSYITVSLPLRVTKGSGRNSEFQGFPSALLLGFRGTCCQLWNYRMTKTRVPIYPTNYEYLGMNHAYLSCMPVTAACVSWCSFLIFLMSGDICPRGLPRNLGLEITRITILFLKPSCPLFWLNSENVDIYDRFRF